MNGRHTDGSLYIMTRVGGSGFLVRGFRGKLVLEFTLICRAVRFVYRRDWLEYSWNGSYLAVAVERRLEIQQDSSTSPPDLFDKGEKEGCGLVAPHFS